MAKIGKYKIIDLLGQGGMGKVYKARIPIIDEVVAVKVLSPIDEFLDDVEELRARFLQEAKILWKLKHPYIVPITDVDEVEGVPFYVMEYIPNNLADELGFGEGTRIHKGQMPEQKILRITREVLSALEFLHENSIVHRDIKPENILLTKNGSAKLADFGIAKVVGKTGYTTSGIYLGTHDFSAPEQTEAKNVDHRADLYSLGIVLYMLLTGQHPYQTRFEKPSILNKSLPTNWDDLIRKGTEPKPGGRFQSAQEMLEGLNRISGAGHDVWSQKRASALSSQRPVIDNKPPYHLRNEPLTVSEKEFEEVYRLDTDRRPREYVENNFEDNGDGTVTDHATGLMWQQSGSDEYLEYNEVQSYITQLNNKQFAGYNDWRLPTVPELISLLEPEKQSNGIYNDPAFDDKQQWCWSADKDSSDSAWYVSSNDGEVHSLFLTSHLYVRAVRSC